MIKKSLIKIVFIFKLFINLYTPEEFAYKDGWDCVEKILFNPNLMKILLKMNDSQCERDILDFKTIFGAVDMGGEESLDSKDSLNEVLNEVGKLDSKIGKNDLENFEEQLEKNRMMHINRQDTERNSEFDKITLNTAYTKKNFKAIKSESTNYLYQITFEKEGNKAIEFLKNLDKFKIPETPETVNIKKTNISKNKFDKNLTLDKGFAENDDSAYKFTATNISKLGDQKTDINEIAEKLQNNENSKKEEAKTNEKNENDSEEEEPHNFINFEEDLEDEIEILEPDGDFYTSAEFTVKPLLKIKIENYNEQETAETIEVGQTFYAVQTRLKPKQTRLLETDKRTNAEIIKELLLYFELLPKCIQRALNQCPILMENVLKRCNKFYEDRNLECRHIVNEMKVNIKCKIDEDFFNNACYKKCPKGYKDGKLYCVRSKYMRRSTAPFLNQGIDFNTETLWGDKYIVKKCSNFGNRWNEVGSDYCRMTCPPGWQNSGILCRKPYRFLNQQIFLFSQDDVNK